MNQTRARYTIGTALVAAAVLLTTSPTGAAETVTGHFTLGDKALKPSAVAAFRIRDTSRPRELSTYVMLTQTPVAREAIARDLDPYAVAINDEAVRDADYIAFFVRGDGTIGMNAHVGGTQYIDSTGSIMGQKGSLVATCESNTTERIACSVKVAAPVKAMGGPSWTMDVAFDAPVLARPAGKRLPADGGDPAKAFIALCQAVQGDDLAAIIAGLSASQAQSYQRDYNTPEENLKDAKTTLGFQLPKKPIVTGGELVDEATALLEVEGVAGDEGKMKMLYLVEMRREKERWVLDSSHAAGMLD